MTWLVDTNVLSELRKGDRANDGVRDWFATTGDLELFTSVLVVGELRRGAELLRRRDATAAIVLDQWLQQLVTSFDDRLIPVDQDIAERWGRINVPNPLPSVDGLLAATAIEREMVLVTRNLRDVERAGVEVFDPFSAADP